MNKTLQDKLFEKYPKIFRDRTLPMSQTCMCWGIETSDGWYDIIDSLCEALTYTYTTSIKIDMDDGKKLGIEPSTYGGETNCYCEIAPPQVVADQLKEKFGTLRFYYHTELDEKMSYLQKTGKYPELDKILERYYNYFDGIVHYAEVLSGRTCEETGKPGEMHVSGGSLGGWYRVLNKEHAQTDSNLKDRNYVPTATLKE